LCEKLLKISNGRFMFKNILRDEKRNFFGFLSPHLLFFSFLCSTFSFLYKFVLYVRWTRLKIWSSLINFIIEGDSNATPLVRHTYPIAMLRETKFVKIKVIIIIFNNVLFLTWVWKENGLYWLKLKDWMRKINELLPFILFFWQ